MKKKVTLSASSQPESIRSLAKLYDCKMKRVRRGVKGKRRGTWVIGEPNVKFYDSTLAKLLMTELEMKLCGYASPPAQTGARDEM